MIFAKIVLSLTGAVFLFFGLRFLVAPAEMASLVSLSLTTPTAITEIRAMYGGLETGLGIFFLVAVFRERWIRAALGAQMLTLGGLAGGRLFGMLSGPPSRIMVFFMAVEGIGLAVGLAAFVHAKHVLISSRSERRILD